jgi:hypothetical protein
LARTFPVTVTDLTVTRAPPQPTVIVTKWGPPVTFKQALADSFGNIVYKLSDINEAAALAALFQQYRLVKVMTCFRPMYRCNPIIDDDLVVMPLIYVAVDPNDSNTWANLTQARNHSNVVVSDDAKAFAITFRQGITWLVGR